MHQKSREQAASDMSYVVIATLNPWLEVYWITVSTDRLVAAIEKFCQEMTNKMKMIPSTWPADSRLGILKPKNG